MPKNDQNDIIKSLAEKNARLAVSCRQISRSELTPGEQTAIIPNAAIVDRSNLRLLSRIPVKNRAPFGATDLTNMVNIPDGTVPMHPVISLYEQIVSFLEDQKADKEVCKKGREICRSLDNLHRGSLKTYGLNDEWPDFRASWEAMMRDKGIIPKEYDHDRPSDGVSPEWIAYKIAKESNVIPDFNDCDPDAVEDSLREAGVPAMDIPGKAETIVAAGKAKVEAKLASWEQLNKTIVETYDEAVVHPFDQYGKAWMMTCKSIDGETIGKMKEFSEGVVKVADASSPLAALVLKQSVETANIAILSPNLNDQAMKVGGGILEWIISEAAKGGTDTASEIAIEKAEGALLGSLGPSGKLLYFAVKNAYHIAGSPGSRLIQDKIEKGIHGLTSWARHKLDSATFEQDYNRTVGSAAKNHLDKSPLDELQASTLVETMSTEGMRSAELLCNIYEQINNPTLIEKYKAKRAASEVAEFAVQVTASIMPFDGRVDFDDRLGLEIPLKGSRWEVGESSRIVVAGLTRANFPEALAYTSPRWVKGEDRLMHSYKSAEKTFQEINTPPSAPEAVDPAKIYEEGVQRGCMRSTAYCMDFYVEPLDGERVVVSDKGLSKLMFAVEDTMLYEHGIKSPSRYARNDWPVVLAVNAGLSAGTMHPNDLRNAMSIRSEKLLPPDLNKEKRVSKRQVAELTPGNPRTIDE